MVKLYVGPLSIPEDEEQSLPHRLGVFYEMQSSKGREQGAAGDAEHCGPLLKGLAAKSVYPE